MVKLYYIAFFATVLLTVKSDTSSSDYEEESDVDPTFYRRLDEVEHRFHRDPFTADFLKYFIRNRAQKRERRQIINDYYYNAYQQPQQLYRNDQGQTNPGVSNTYSTIKNPPPAPVVRTQPQYQQTLTRNVQRRQGQGQRRQQGQFQRVQGSGNRNNNRGVSNLRNGNNRKKFLPKPVFF